MVAFLLAFVYSWVGGQSCSNVLAFAVHGDCTLGLVPVFVRSPFEEPSWGIKSHIKLVLSYAF